MVQGILEWLVEQNVRGHKGKSRQATMKIIKSCKNTIRDFVARIDIKYRNDEMSWENDDPELGLRNPYSKVTCFILYLYSLEMGSPPLYSEANRVARDMDLTHLRTLGPYLRALSLITASAEAERQPDDLITTGKMHADISAGHGFNLSGVFLLYRGAPMRDKWIEPYEELVPKKKGSSFQEVYLPGNQSCSQNPKVALKFAFNPRKPDHSPCLFILSCQNYFCPAGVRMNNPAFSSYPAEDEVLLMEGCNVYVLEVERGVKV